MIKKIDIMGIGLDNYTVRESMRQVENYLSNDVLNTIENISMQMLIASETDPVLHNVISELDLSVIGEKEILKAADADSMQRVQETEQNDFSYEFYRRIERNKRSIFVLGQTEEGVQKVKAELQEAFPKLILAGEYALENCVGNLDAVINEMNASLPYSVPLQCIRHRKRLSKTKFLPLDLLLRYIQLHPIRTFPACGYPSAEYQDAAPDKAGWRHLPPLQDPRP